MKKTIITLPNPCHEDWAKMLPNEKGKFCEVCKNCVHDFTKMANIEVAKFLYENKDKEICGRFTDDQLNVMIPMHEQGVPFNSMPKLAEPNPAGYTTGGLPSLETIITLDSPPPPGTQSLGRYPKIYFSKKLYQNIKQSK